MKNPLSKEMMADVMQLAKKLPKGSKMEIEMPSMKADKKYDKEGMCPHCGAPMKEEIEYSAKELRDKLKD